MFEYPSFESVSSATGQEELPADMPEKEDEEAEHNKQQNIFKANTAVGSSGKIFFKDSEKLPFFGPSYWSKTERKKDKFYNKIRR